MFNFLSCFFFLVSSFCYGIRLLHLPYGHTLFPPASSLLPCLHPYVLCFISSITGRHCTISKTQSTHLKVQFFTMPIPRHPLLLHSFPSFSVCLSRCPSLCPRLACASVSFHYPFSLSLSFHFPAVCVPPDVPLPIYLINNPAVSVCVCMCCSRPYFRSSRI